LVAGLLTLFASIIFVYVFVFVACHLLRASGHLQEMPYSPGMMVLPRSIDLGNWFVSRAIVTALVAGSIYLWTAAAGVRRPDEVSATAWAGMLIALWWLGVFGLAQSFDRQWLWNDGWSITAAVQSASPGGIGTISVPKSPLPLRSVFGVALPVAIGGAFHLVLAYWFIICYGSVPVRVRSPQTALAPFEHANWLGPPRRSPLAAIAWKQFRESGPVVLAGIAGIVAVFLAIVMASWRQIGPGDAGGVMMSLSIVVGLFVSLVIGIGTFLSDVSPSLNTFWRSRPINPNGWFWIKILTNLAILEIPVVGVFVGVSATVLALGGDPNRIAIDVAVVTLLAPIWVFSAAALMTSLVRHAIYAAILALAAMYAGFLFLLGVYWSTQVALGSVDWHDRIDVTNSESAGIIAVLIVVYTLIAWLAVRYDWGRKN
jgi:hypothetical protein